MLVGGAKLGAVREALKVYTTVGTTFEAIEAEAQRLISQAGALPSFSTVAGYHWATCVMVNDALCHGIPINDVVHDGDIVTIDVGLIYQGFHTDTTTTFGVGNVSEKKQQFLEIGIESLRNAIAQVKAGATVYEVSAAMYQVLHRHHYGAVEQLTGHGVGAQLHEAPNIPCHPNPADKRIILSEGQTIAVEVMYAQGSAQLKVDPDGWTYRTKDGQLSGMFEDTVLVTKDGFQILTTPSSCGL